MLYAPRSVLPAVVASVVKPLPDVSIVCDAAARLRRISADLVASMLASCSSGICCGAVAFGVPPPKHKLHLLYKRLVLSLCVALVKCQACHPVEPINHAVRLVRYGKRERQPVAQVR